MFSRGILTESLATVGWLGRQLNESTARSCGCKGWISSDGLADNTPLCLSQAGPSSAVCFHSISLLFHPVPSANFARLGCHRPGLCLSTLYHPCITTSSPDMHQQDHHHDQLLSKRRLTQDARTASDASFQSSASDL